MCADAARAVAVAGCVTLAALADSLAQAQDSSAEGTYAAILREIADMETSIAHREVYLETQRAEIASLEQQISEVQGTIDSIGPMISKMVSSISSEIDSDIPFNAEERFNRLGKLQEVVADPEAAVSDKWRRALEIYKAEVFYGNTMQAYSGNHPTAPGTRLQACRDNRKSSACAIDNVSREVSKRLENGATIDEVADGLRDGTYLRYGRLSFVYLQADDSEVLRYDPETGEWAGVVGGRALGIRRAVKIAVGEAAPGVVEVPVYVSN